MRAVLVTAGATAVVCAVLGLAIIGFVNVFIFRSKRRPSSRQGA